MKTKQYKIKLLSLDDLRKQKNNHIHLDDNEKKTYNGTILVTIFSNLMDVICTEPTKERIINVINNLLTNDLYKCNNSAKLIHQILNSENSHLHDFIMNYDQHNVTNNVAVACADVVDR